jgi:YVTN family beta-propeller protein
MYVANGVSNNISVIYSATNTVIDTIHVGTRPFGITFNPENGFLYVANFGGNTASAIAPLTTTFSEGCNSTVGKAGQAATCTVTSACGRLA